MIMKNLYFIRALDFHFLRGLCIYFSIYIGYIATAFSAPYAFTVFFSDLACSLTLESRSSVTIIKKFDHELKS